MIDHSRPTDPTTPPPSFIPVPRHTTRHDGWTPARQQGFIEALMATGNVKAAAHAVNMTPEGAYMLRRHPEAESFRAAWEEALALGVQRLEDIAMERAIHGTQVPVYSYGKLVGTRTVHNDRLLMFLLRNRATDRFAASSTPAALSRQKLERLKREWHAEWKAAHEGSIASGDEIQASLNRKIQALRQQIQSNLSPRTRQLKAEYDAALKQDERDYFRRKNEEKSRGEEE